tara:strand:- start:183284 stop:184144 length:861 start_codon:yes stop_codon:yes gene_type:complete
MTYKTLCILFCGALLSVTSFKPSSDLYAQAAVSDDVELLSHKAVYDVSLSETKPSSTITSIKGQMVYTLNYDCAAWNTIYDFDLVYHFSDKPSAHVKTQTVTYEPVNGEKYNFAMNHIIAGKKIEAMRGHAQKEQSGGSKSIRATYTKPDALQEIYEGDLIFPTEHSKSVIRRARADKRFFSLDVFDGLERKGVTTISTLISQADPNDNAMATRFEGIDESAEKWRVNMAYFTKSAKSANRGMSDYELSATLYETGVLSDIRLNYHDYVLKQDLVDFTVLETPHCP